MSNATPNNGRSSDEQDLAQSLSMLPTQVLSELKNLPPEFLETLGRLSPVALDTLSRLPLSMLSRLQRLSAATLEWLGSAGAELAELPMDSLAKFAQLASDNPNAVKELKRLPAGTIHALMAVPPDVMTSLSELPAEMLKQLPDALSGASETMAEIDRNIADKSDDFGNATLDALNPHAIQTLTELPADSIATLAEVDPSVLGTIAELPETVLATIADLAPGALTTVLAVPLTDMETVATDCDKFVFEEIAKQSKDKKTRAEPTVSPQVFKKISQARIAPTRPLTDIMSEARSMRDLSSALEKSQEKLDEFERADETRDQVQKFDDGSADGDSNQTMQSDDWSEGLSALDAQPQSRRGRSETESADFSHGIDPEGDSEDASGDEDSYGATIQSDDLSVDLANANKSRDDDDSEESYGATIQSDDSVGGFKNVDGLRDDEEDSYGATIQSDEFASGDKAGSDDDDSYGATIQSDEGFSAEGLSAFDNSSSGGRAKAKPDEDDSFGATIQSGSSFNLPEDDSFGATIQSGSSFNLPDQDEDNGRTMVSEEFSVDGGDDIQKTMASIWGDDEASHEPGMTMKGRDRRGPPPRNKETLVITTRQMSTKDLPEKHAAMRRPEPKSPDYALLNVLGEGGMGIVWEAKQRSIDRDVAMKMLKAKSAKDKEQRAKFLAEAVVTGELDHPNIVPIYELGATADDELFYTMKKVKGTPWLKKIKDLSVAQNLEILLRCCDAVAFAHARGVIHRDLKPENVMLGDFGEMLVMDWGLAYATKEFQKSQSITENTSMGGTPAYMAPEMATGPITKVGPHSDVYLLGAMLFEVITTKPPHAGKNAMKCLMAAARNEIREGDPEILQKNDPTGELMSIAMRSMATDIKERHVSVLDFQKAIINYQSHTESVMLAGRAMADLKTARETDSYQDYARTIFGFEEAYELWSGNKAAEEGAIEAKFDYANSAKRRGDFDLGMSLLNLSIPAHKQLYAELEQGVAEREARKAAVARYKKIGAVAACVFMAVISGAAIWINAERNEAIAQKIEADTQRELAVKNEEKAKEQEGIAKQNLVEAERQKVIAVANEKEALKQKEEADRQRLVAQTNFEEAEKQRKVAQKNFEEAAKQRMLAETNEKEAIKQKDEADTQRMKAVKNEKEAIAQKEEAEKQRLLAEKNFKDAETQRAKAEKNFIEAEKQRTLAVTNEKEATKQAGIAKMNAEEALKQKGIAEKNADEAKKQQLLAEKNAKEAREQEKKAKDNEVEALKQKGIAEKNETEAKKQQMIAQTNEKKAIEQEGIAKKNEAEALRQKKIADDQRLIAEEKRKEAEIAKAAEEYQGYIARIGLADARIRENAFDSAVQILNACPKELRNWEWGRLMHLCTLSKGSFDNGARVDALAISPTGGRFVTGGWNGEAVVWDSVSGKSLKTLKHAGNYVHAVAYSPDGKWIATGSNDPINGWIQLWNAETGERVARKFGKEKLGHDDAVLSVQFSKDGSKLLTASYDNTARLWNVATGEQQRVFTGHTWWVWDAKFSPKEDKVVTASQDGTAIVWETATGKAGPPFTAHQGPVYSVAFSHDGFTVATGGYDKRVLLWKPSDVRPYDFTKLASKDGQVLQPQKFKALDGHAGPVRSVMFSQDGQVLISGSQDNTVRLWSTDSAQVVKSFRGHDGAVRAVSFAESDQVVLSASHDNHIKKWSIGQYEEIRVLQGVVLEGHVDAILAVGFSPDGKQVVTASRDRTARTWDSKTGGQLKVFSEGHSFLASNAVYFPDGRRLATAAVDNTVRIWDTDSGTQVKVLEHTGRAAAINVSADGKWLITGGDDRSAKVFDAASGELKFTLPDHRSEVTAVAISPDNRLALTGDLRGRVAVWDIKAQKIVHELTGHSRSRITGAAFVDDQRAVTSSADNTVAQWNVSTGKEFPNLILKHTDSVNSIALRPKTRQLLTACEDKKVRVWDLDTAKVIGTFNADVSINSVATDNAGEWALAVDTEGRKVHLWKLGTSEVIKPERTLDVKSLLWSAIFAPTRDGQTLLALGGSDARLINVETKETRMTFSPHGVVTSANFSPKGDRLVTGSWDYSARIWNAVSGADELKLGGDQGHTANVNSAVFSPDGKWVLTGSDDHTAKLWDAKTGKVVRTFEGHTDRVSHATFSLDGSRIVTSSHDKTSIVWDTATGNRVGQPLKAHTLAVLNAQFSKDATHLITGSEDTTAIVWDVATSKALLKLSGHTARVTSVAFAPTGNRAVTASLDGSVKLWDTNASATSQKKPEADLAQIADGKEILTLDGHTREVTSVTFSPDGRYVLTGSQDGRAILWLAMEWSAVGQKETAKK